MDFVQNSQSPIKNLNSYFKIKNITTRNSSFRRDPHKENHFIRHIELSWGPQI